MNTPHNLQQRLHAKYIGIRALQGAALAFALISLLLIVIYFTSKGDAGFGNWVLIPLFTVTVGGAFGGIFYYLMDHVRYHGGWKKIFANILSVLAYIVSLYLSLIIALNITGHWD